MEYNDLINEWELLDNNNFLIKSITIKDLIKLINQNRLNPDNKYQRNSGVWSLTEKINFLKSLEEGMPTPIIYLYYDEELSLFSCLDGFQRITLFKDLKDGILENDLKRETMEYNNLIECEIPLILYKAPEYKYIEFFKKINSTGVKVRNQELRRSGEQDSDIRKWILNNNDKMEEYKKILIHDLKTFSDKKIIRQEHEEYIVWLLEIERNQSNNILEMKNTDKKNLDYFYRNQSAPSNDEWQNILIKLRKISSIVNSSNLKRYSKKITPKGYLYNFYYLLSNNLYWQINEDIENMIKDIEVAFANMTSESNADTKRNPWEEYKIKRTTIASDRMKSLEVFLEFLNSE